MLDNYVSKCNYSMHIVSQTTVYIRDKRFYMKEIVYENLNF